MTRTLSADWVVTGEGAPIADGVVLVDGETIVDVRERLASDDCEHFRGVILPGLVNPHTHLEGSAFAGKVEPGGGIAAFAWEYKQAIRSTSMDDVRRSAQAAVDALVECGTALVGDVTNTGVAAPMLARAPIRSVVFHECIAGAPGIPVDGASLAAHAPYSSPPEWLAETYGIAASSDGLTSVHLAEHADERRFLLDGDGPIQELYRMLGVDVRFPIPRRPSVPYLADLGALGPHSLAVHVCDATPMERETLRERRSPIVLCPRSNDFIGGALPDLPAILAEGSQPALGTDSLASSPSLDVLEEAGVLHAAFPDVPCRALVAMATSWGAAAMRRPLLGAIVKGRAPGLLLAPPDDSADVPADPERWLVESSPPRRWLVGPGGSA